MDFLINIRDTHVIYIEIHGTQIWMETAKKYGTYKKTMEFAQHGLNMHIEEVKERLMKDFETQKVKHIFNKIFFNFPIDRPFHILYNVGVKRKENRQ